MYVSHNVNICNSVGIRDTDFCHSLVCHKSMIISQAREIHFTRNASSSYTAFNYFGINNYEDTDYLKTDDILNRDKT
jgi:hypothetical protein